MREIDPPSIIIQADVGLEAAQKAQQLAEIKNAAIRHAERMAFMNEWVKPEAVALRKEQHDKEAAAALALGQAASAAIRANQRPLEEGELAISFFPKLSDRIKIKDK